MRREQLEQLMLQQQQANEQAVQMQHQFAMQQQQGQQLQQFLMPMIQKLQRTRLFITGTAQSV